MNFFVETYGCQMNKADSINVIESLKKRDYKLVDNPQDADIVIINTCSVRKTAENRIWGRLGFYKNLKKIAKESYNRDIVLLIMGCMSQRLGEDLLKTDRTVDLVIGTYYKNKIPDILLNFHKGQRQVFIEQKDNPFYESYPDEQNRRKAFVTISHGCNNFCSYCIVPYLRGREQSRNSTEIINDIKQLTAKGVWQVTLLGQNVNSYGTDTNDISFSGLLKRICRETDIKWIKYLSSHPKDFTNELIDLIAAEEKISNWVHLAVQSGSNNVLKRMNRKYRIEDYLNKVERLKNLVPDVHITTDIIVGFNGESEADFQDTYNLIKTVEFGDAYLYKYNIRENTIASNDCTDEVPDEIKQERLAKIIELQREITLKKRQQRIGSTLEVISERWSKNNKNEILGLSKEELTVVYQGSNDDFEKILNVKAVKMRGNTIYCEKCQKT